MSFETSPVSRKIGPKKIVFESLSGDVSAGGRPADHASR